MRYSECSKSKFMSAEEAISMVKSCHRIVVGHAVAEPVSLVDELVRQKDRLQNIEVVHMVSLRDLPYCTEEVSKRIRHNALFTSPSARKAISNNWADFTPTNFSDIPRLFRDKILPVDIALIQVAPPDKHGYCSFGVSVDYTMAVADAAKIVIAEINQQMPKTYGANIHISEFDAIVEVDRPLMELAPSEISDVEKGIGQYIASLVPDRANLQLGIGAIPDAVLNFLHDKENLGIHTEMFSDGVVDLYYKGVVTSKYNNVNPKKLVATFLMGTQKLYDFVDDNPVVRMRPVDYTNNVMVAGQVDNLISINSALQIDLYGQICADTIGYMQFSAVGGQVDFVRAANHSKGGKSIIALPSTAKNGTISRIVPVFDGGTCVTTSRNDVHYVVTEYGIAHLRGKNLRDRAKELINIAHPQFREELLKKSRLQECPV